MRFSLLDFFLPASGIRRYAIPVLWTAVLISGCTGEKKQREPEQSVISDSASGFQKDIESLTARINQNPTDASLLHSRATLYLKQKDFTHALDDIRMAVQLDSTHAEYFITMADIWFAGNRIYNARSALEKAVSLDNNNIEARSRLAEIFFLIRKYPEALEQVAEILRKEPGNAEIRFMQAMIYKEAGDTAKAVNLFQEIVEKDNMNYKSYMQLGVLYSIRNSPICIEYFNHALRVRPQSEEALYGRALFYQEHDEIDKAIRDYTSILQLNPKNKNAHFNLGYIHYTLLKVYDQAIKHYDDAIAADAGYAEAYYNRGLCYETLGNIQAAQLDYEKALQLRPGYELAKKGMERIRN